MGYIYCLDLSLTSTGYTIADEDLVVVEIGTILTEHRFSIDKRLKKIWNGFEEKIKQYPPKIVLIERGFTLHNNATQQLYRVHGIINLIFEGVKQVYVSPSTIKKFVTGKGRARKEEVYKYMKKEYPFLRCKNLDESDSLALFYYYVNAYKESEVNGNN